MKRFIVTSLVSKRDYKWLERDYKPGTVVYEYLGYTYGAVSPEGVACTRLADELPFEELPKDCLTPLD